MKETTGCLNSNCFGDGIVAFQSQADTVVQCAEVDTGVVFVRLFPSDVMVTFG